MRFPCCPHIEREALHQFRTVILLYPFGMAHDNHTLLSFTYVVITDTDRAPIHYVLLYEGVLLCEPN
jgi:hypothetical protein